MSTATPSATAGAGAPPSAIVSASELQLPSEKALKHAARVSIEQDKPIMLDYYNETREGKAFMGEDSKTKEKMLVRSEEEYTSLIQKIFKVGEDFVAVTENSVYIIAGNTIKRSINAPRE
jgi:hypothetical protein